MVEQPPVDRPDPQAVCYGCRRPSARRLCPDCGKELNRWLWSVLEAAGIDPRWKDYYGGDAEDG